MPTNRVSCTAMIIAGLMLLAAISESTHAALIAYDSFSTNGPGSDYASGAIRPQNPTAGLSGFTGGWDTASAATGVIVADATGGLTHPNMIGTALNGRAAPSPAGGAVASNTRRLFRTINYTPINGTYYVSFLMEKTVSTTAFDMLLGLSEIGTGNYTESSWESAVGGIYMGIYNGGIGFSQGGGLTTTTLLTAANTTVGETFLGLMQINYSTTAGSSSVTANVYNESSTLVATQTFTGLSLNIPRLSLATNNREGNTVVVDEFRFGTALNDVFVPIPEPSTLALLSTGLLGMLAYRRWRKN